ncbi:MAG: FemAB family PEP-CTERM system-associated protein [Desulfuromonadaceae bacterium]|nr:FemAB family PEP-CTERM system-associated protein [Desulfuromonadaceae bacterium]
MITVEHDCTDRSQWDTYVAEQPHASNYHRYRWRDVVEKSFGHPCHYLTARNADGRIVGVLPLVFMKSRLFGCFLVSQPFFNYGGLLSDSREAGDALLAEAAALRQRLGAEHVEMRHTEPWMGELPTKQAKVSMLLALAPDRDSLWQGFNAKLRNQVRKAEKSGLTAVVGGQELLADYYTVFVRNMRDLGTPVYAKKFFAEVLAAFTDDANIIAVNLEGKPVAAGLVVRYRDTLEIPWASSIRDYNPLCPNNLLYWTALQHALAIGCTRFDFGRSTPGEGTYKFKEQWGAKPIQLHWQYLLPDGASLPELNTKNPKFEMAIRLWQKLPLPVTTLVGPHIVKNIP